MSELIPLPESLVPFLESYLPNESNTNHPNRPFVTLTYAQSLDSRISAKPGTQTKISHMETKTMTHYLRTRHDGILVGIGTILADDPKLTCRFPNCKSQPRPIIIDPNAKWKYQYSTLAGLCRADDNVLAPFIIVDESATIDSGSYDCVVKQGGKYIRLPLRGNSSNWLDILDILKQEGIKSVMIEGGARVINDLLDFNQVTNIIDSLIITIAPVFLGNEGVEVSPGGRVDVQNVTWWQGIQDTVLCGRP
ncbi:25-diamino-6-ribosylamino-4 [Spathaspora sp. JA1]|nr:25-diamino-6-ribosylamino-4 [Spathaspora sp. JA1]